MAIKVGLAASALLLSTMLSGCVVVFSDPISASQSVLLDERLIGRWSGADEQGTTYTVIFEKTVERWVNRFITEPRLSRPVTSRGDCDYFWG